jgi:hypothetical protein
MEDILPLNPAICHDIMDLCERELVTLGGAGIEKENQAVGAL